MDYPPKNRRPTELPILHLEVEDKNGVKVFDPNGIVLWILEHGEETLAPFPPGIVKYRSLDLEIPLRLEALVQLVLLNLTRVQYFALLNQYGMAFEWHEDFYDPDTGIALQPHRR
jgi:hypothetical protein